MTATISIIAKEAGVSTATVSRVLNSNAKVNEDTKARVMAAVKKYNYSPSTIARGLKIKSMKTIAIVVKSFTMLHHMRIADVISTHFSRNGYDVMMFETGEDQDALSLFLRHTLDKSVDGIIFIGSTFQILSSCPETKTLLSSIPVVISNGWIEGSYGIMVDEKEGAEKVVEHLYERGKRNLLFIHSSDTESCRKKKEGFYSKANELKAEANETRCGRTMEEIKETLSGLSFDALVAEDDILAAKALSVLLSQGRRVPEETAVVGFNASEYSALTYPPLTSLDNKAEEQGEECALLLERILSGEEGGDIEKKILKTLHTSLVVRSTT